MATTKVDINLISATGTASSSTFLRGDSSWNAAGGLVFISNTDISSAATYDFESFTAGSYEHYMFALQNLVPATDAVHLWVRTSTDAGSTYDSTGTHYSWGGSAAASEDYDIADDNIALTGDSTGGTAMVGSAAAETGVSGTIWLHGPHVAAYTHVSSNITYAGSNGSSNTSCNIGGQRLSAADVDGFRLLFSSGNIESGTITAYGLVNA